MSQQTSECNIFLLQIFPLAHLIDAVSSLWVYLKTLLHVLLINFNQRLVVQLVGLKYLYGLNFWGNFVIGVVSYFLESLLQFLRKTVSLWFLGVPKIASLC